MASKTPICMFCGNFCGESNKDYGYYPEIRYYCDKCAEGELD